MAKKDFNNLGTWLPPRIEATGMSIEKFSYKAGLSKAIVYFYMQDKYRPSAESMIRMCKVLGVPAEEGLAQYTERKVGAPRKGERRTPELSLRASRRG